LSFVHSKLCTGK